MSSPILTSESFSPNLSPYFKTNFQSPQKPLQHDDILSILEIKTNYVKNYTTRFQQAYSPILKPDYPNKQASSAFQKLDDGLNLLVAHLNFLLAMSEAETGQDIQECKETHKVSQLYPDVHSKEDISVKSLIECIDMVVPKLFKSVEEALGTGLAKKYKDGVVKVSKKSSVMEKAFTLGTKLEYLMQFFNLVPMLSKNELFRDGRNTADWTKIKEVVVFKEVAKKEDIQKFVDELNGLLNFANALLHEDHKIKKSGKWKDFGIMRAIKNGVYYSLKKEKAKVVGELKVAERDMNIAISLYRMDDTIFFKRLRRMILSRVKVEKKIYIPRLFPRITQESILKEYSDGTLQQMRENTFKAPDLQSQKEEVLKTLYTKDKQKIRIRFASNRPLKEICKSNPKAKGADKYKENNRIEGIVIHIHGGGFISMSSSGYRDTLHSITRIIDVPIFSIDYRLAPENPYPAALDDVWQAYNWIINYCESILDISTKKIIMFGDSAGGNLVMSLTLRAIREGVRVPDGMSLVYPSLNVYPLYFVPSYLYSLDDLTLPYNVMPLILKMYSEGGMRPDIDPFMSSAVASDELLRKLPPVRVSTGSMDPLHDDVWILFKRLHDLGVNVKGVVYENMPHGYLGMFKIPGHKQMFDETYDGIKELFWIGGN